MQLRSLLSWRPLAIALVGGATAVSGLDAATHAALLSIAQLTPPSESNASPSSLPAAGTKQGRAAPSDADQPIARPGAGVVSALLPDPPSLTIRQPDGQERTYRVTAATVFVAGPDRPYHFDLIQPGDQVRVKGGVPGAKKAAPGGTDAGGPATSAARKKGDAARASARGGVSGDPALPIARRVTVRPQAELAAGKNKSRTAGQRQQALPSTAGDSATQTSPTRKGDLHGAAQ